jgi:RNA polymerase sigma-70 factor (ECF subfamily)
LIRVKQRRRLVAVGSVIAANRGDEMTTNVAPALENRAVMRELHEGSTAALAAHFERTAPILYPLALRITGSRDRACCVLEDLFEEAWRDRARRHATASIPLGSLIARCRELSLAFLAPEETVTPRRPMTTARCEEPASAPVPSDSSVETSSDATQPMDASAAVDTSPEPEIEPGDLGAPLTRQIALEALEALPAADRQALEEAYFRGLNASEIAARLGSPTSEAEAMLRRALVRFRSHIDPGVEAAGETGAA